jgi:L-malate glycosyltransferase
MKILHTVEFYEPSKGGMQEVVKQLSERLVEYGHEVTVATTKIPGRKYCINGVNIKEFKLSGNLVNGILGNDSEYKLFLLNSKFDIITNFAAQQWATDCTLDLLPALSAKKVFVPTGFSALNFPEYKNYFEYLKERMHHYDVNIFLSQTGQDYKFAVENKIKNRMILPNGADEKEFDAPTDVLIRKKLGIPEENFLVLHVGSHTGMKGHAEAIEIFKRAKIPNSTFVIVGNVFSKRCYYECKIKEIFTPGLIVTNNLSRKDTVALYKTADLFLFPSNIECSPIVLFECMASKTPFMTTDVGNAREIVQWSGAGWMIQTEKDKNGYSHAYIPDAVDLMKHVWNDKRGRNVAGTLGYQVWKENFTWEKISRYYETLYKELLK